MRRRLSPFAVYLILEFSSSLFFSLIFTVNMVYQLTVVRLAPLQLVLVGTILEATVFLLEVPTGVLADVKSRRLSVIVGYVIVGLGFILEGSLPFFWSVALAQVVWGFGYTFTSGATQAWIADEMGSRNSTDGESSQPPGQGNPWNYPRRINNHWRETKGRKTLVNGTIVVSIMKLD